MSRIEDILHSNYDDELFWLRLEDMPDCEALELVMARRVWAVAESAKLRGTASQEMNNLVTLLNAEIRRRNLRLDSLHWARAIKAVFGEEGYHQVREWKAKNFDNALHMPNGK